MKLVDYINVTYKNSASYKELGFYDSNDIKAEWLNRHVVPSPEKILEHQKKMFMSYYQHKWDLPQISKLIMEINKDLNDDGSSINYDFDRYIAKIEEGIRDIDYLREKLDLIKQTGFVSEVNSLIQEYRTFFTTLSEEMNSSRISFAFKALLDKLDFLENQILSSTGKTIPINKSTSFKKRLSWVEYIIKGEYLEQAGLQFFIQRIPSRLVLQTGALKGAFTIGGEWASQSMKEDLMIFSNNDFKVSYYTRDANGNDIPHENVPIEKFIEEVHSYSGKSSIFITKESYQTMQKNLVTAVQAKATATNHINFGNINIRRAILDNENHGMALLTLKEIYEASENNKRHLLVQEHKDYTALFNYVLAHNLARLVGENNKLILTRHGVDSMYNFIMNSFNKNKMFYGINFTLKGNAATRVAFDF